MVGKAVAHTEADKRRFQLLQEIGCICCRACNIEREPADIHHIIDGGRRMGHQYTLPLCPYHHRGQPKEGLTQKQMDKFLGPSLALNKRKFDEVFGGELTLLEYVDKMLAKIEESFVGG